MLYEHKTRLEKNLQAEIERKKAVDEELKTLQAALARDVVRQKEKVAKLLRQYEELKVSFHLVLQPRARYREESGIGSLILRSIRRNNRKTNSTS